MLAEMIRAIRELSQQADDIKVKDIDQESTVISHSGTVSIQARLHRRRHTVNKIDDLNNAIERWCQTGTVWHDVQSITVITDDDTRRDQITLKLNDSPAWQLLKSLSKEGLTQSVLIHHLRNGLHSCGGDTLLSLVRRVEFRSGAVTDAKRDSLGTSVDKAINVAGDLPEVVSFTVSVYSNTDIVRPVVVRCSLDVDFTTGRFVMLPLPLELESGMSATHLWISDAITTPEGVNVFEGSHE